MHTDQRVALTGIGETDVGETPEMDSMDLYAKACLNAVEDAGLEKEDIDGVVTGYSMVDPELMHSTSLCDRLGLRPSFSTSLKVGGATPFVGIAHAASGIRQGQCENVLVAFADNRRTGWQSSASEFASTTGDIEFQHTYGAMVPSFYAMLAQRHMHEYGTTAEQLAKISVAAHNHAALRNKGQRAREMSVDDVRESTMIAEPLHKPECALISDCGGAVVVSGEETAEQTDNPVELIGYGEGHGSRYIFRRDDLTISEAIQSGQRAFSMAERSPSDIDVAELYDCFAITPLITLEDLGFCDKGEGGTFIDEQGIRVGEGFPINTHGGELAFAGSGVFHITEAVRQLRGEGGATQVKNAETALAHGVGGVLSTNGTLIMEQWS